MEETKNFIETKEKIQKPITMNGTSAIQKTFYKNKVVIDFEFTDNELECGETFSEITLLNFVAKSYAESCLTLMQKLELYDNKDYLSAINKYVIYRFLPAMFCFRHYLELRLKTFYMVITKQQFDMEHDLSILLNNAKKADKDFETTIFIEPLEYIKKYENNIDSHFRYLIDTKFKSTKKVEIPMLDFSKIKKYIQTIEKYFRDYSA